jgi:hypothetical protein
MPLAILFDDIQTQMLSAIEPPSRRDVAAHELWQLLAHWPEDRRSLSIVSFPLPDIFAALPDACVQRAVAERGGRFHAWKPLIAEFSTGGHTAFKQFFINSCRLSATTDPSELLAEILEVCRQPPRAEIELALEQAFDALDPAADERGDTL